MKVQKKSVEKDGELEGLAAAAAAAVAATVLLPRLSCYHAPRIGPRADTVTAPPDTNTSIADSHGRWHTGSGTVSLYPDEDEDMWHSFNLVSEGDRVKASTVRKVQKETASGGTDSQRVRLTLEVVVEDIDFDAVAGRLRLRGRNVLENPHVKLGSYHTLELEKNRKFSLSKECWDKVHFDILRTAQDPTANADVAAVVMQEGLAHVCLITSAMTHVRQKVEQNIPRKGHAAIYGHDKAVNMWHCSAGLSKSVCGTSFMLLPPPVVTGEVLLREDFRGNAAARRLRRRQMRAVGRAGVRQGRIPRVRPPPPKVAGY
jgi:hypothetical protein